MTIEAYYWKDKIDNQISKTQSRKKREQELSLTLDPSSPRPQSTREVIYLNYKSNSLFSQRGR